MQRCLLGFLGFLSCRQVLGAGDWVMLVTAALLAQLMLRLCCGLPSSLLVCLIELAPVYCAETLIKVTGDIWQRRGYSVSVVELFT